MSSTVGNYHYVVYNEFEKPVQFTEKSPQLYGLKNVLRNPREELEPMPISETINEQSGERQLPYNCAVQNNFTDLSDLISATTSKQGREGNVNVYNKCVFFVNNYNDGEVQEKERAKKILDHFPGLISTSTCSDLPGTFQKIASPSFVGVKRSPEIWQHTPVECIDVKPKHANTNAFTDDPIIVSSDSESETTIKETQHSRKLFYVDRDDLTPILTPNVIPGVYKKVSQSTDAVRKTNNPNVFLDTRDKNGTIVRLKDFSSIPDDTNSQLTYKTDKFPLPAQTNIPPKDTTASQQTGIGMSNESSQMEKDDRLWHLAYDILKLPSHNSCVQFNRSKDELIYRNPSTKKKIVYRIVQPADLQLNALAINNEKYFQLGNPTFVQCVSSNSTNIIPTAIGNQTPNGNSKRPRGRPRKISRKKVATLEDHSINQIVQTPSPYTPQLTKHPTIAIPSSPRNRYGRSSKPPSYIENNFKISSDTSRQTPSLDNINDETYKCYVDVSIPPSGEVKVKRERNLPPEYLCNVCNKIYLGKSKMLRHFGAFPDHFSNMGVEQMVKDTSLYTFLVKKVQQPNLTEDQRITLLLKELTDFISQLQSRRSQLVTHKSAIYFVNSMVAQIIGAPEGHYGVDLSALSGPPPPITESTLSETAPARIDYNLSISLDDTIADAKLNLSENMMTSDDSLLRTVDDLVKEGIKNLTGGDEITQNAAPSVINYDHASDNAVEAVNMKETQPPPMLDLSLDLFQFSSN